jgi:hypothetical protein
LAARVIRLKLAEQGSDARLVCEDCGEQATDGVRGWVAVRLDRPHDPDAVVLTYCPACAPQFERDELVARIEP